MNIQISATFLYTNNKLSGKEIRMRILLTIVSKEKLSKNKLH
jgi:hypothetical protein